MNDIPAIEDDCTLVLDGIHYLLRPNFHAIHNIETELSAGFLAIVARLANETVTLQELVVIIHHCMVDGTDRHFLQEAIVRNGVCHALESVVGLFSLLFDGQYHAKTTEDKPPIRDCELKKMCRMYPD